MIKERRTIIRVFDNILRAEIVKRVLKNAGIHSIILNYSKIQSGPLLNQMSEVNLAVPFVQIEEAEKILQIKLL